MTSSPTREEVDMSDELRMRTPAELATELRRLRDHLRGLDSDSPEASLMEDAATYIEGATDSLREHMAALRGAITAAANADAERDERMREDGRREAFEEAARIADKERGDFAGMLQPETAYGAMCVRNAIRARSEGKG